ncbi:hypothetical protein V6N13_009484 [Hibiscus sabdariffa]
MSPSKHSKGIGFTKDHNIVVGNISSPPANGNVWTRTLVRYVKLNSDEARHEGDDHATCELCYVVSTWYFSKPGGWVIEGL